MSEGAAACALLPWDTEFWGFRVARLHDDTLDAARAAAVDAWCAAQGVRCLYFLARPDVAATPAAAAAHGYDLVDVRLRLDCRLAGRGPRGGGDAASAVRSVVTEDVA